jgi:hypothetical protein
MNGVVRFGKEGKLSPANVGPFEVTKKAGPVIYRVALPQDLAGVHTTYSMYQFDINICTTICM